MNTPDTISRLDVYRSIRKGWDINPVTRVKQSKKKLSRAKIKSNFKRENYNG